MAIRVKPRKSAAQIIDEVYGAAIARAKAAGAPQIRSIQVTTAAKEIPFAHILGSPEDSVFINLALDIGFHEGTFPEGALGIMNITPPEAVIIGADIAVKSGKVDVGFMDRFKGTLIITGPRGDVDHAMHEVLDFFSETLHFKVCDISMR